MSKGRLEAFSDGVFAIIITIMVLELKVPRGSNLAALSPVLPIFLSYVLSFVFVGIYWNNHHHMLQVARRVSGPILWANLHLLFWLSLVPFITGWMGENHTAPIPVALYGVIMWMSGLAFTILAHALAKHHGKDSALAIALGKDRKGLASLALYTAGIVLSFVYPWSAIAVYILVAIMWLVPDPRMERAPTTE
jgi:uncharacterized membrane protein